MLAVSERILEYRPPSEIVDVRTGKVSPEILLTPQDKLCIASFDEMNAAHFALHSEVVSLQLELETLGAQGQELAARLSTAYKSFTETLQSHSHKIFSHDVEALQTVYELRRRCEQLSLESADAQRYIQFILGSKSYRAAALARDSYKSMRRTLDAILAPLSKKEKENVAPVATSEGSPEELRYDGAGKVVEEKKAYVFTDENDSYRLANPYADVNNFETSLEIFRDWVSIFHYQGKRLGSQQPLVHDQVDYIYDLNTAFPLAGKRILEIGPLEGANTKQLHDLGASEVVAVESNQQSFIKCLLIQNLFKLKNAEFVYGDCNKLLGSEEFQGRGKFDLCFATGVLYHMEDPLLAIDRFAASSDRVFVWTQVASERTPAGDWVTLKDSLGRSYRGRVNNYTPADALGGVGHFSVWLTQESLQQAFQDRGFTLQDFGDRATSKGDSSTFLAVRK